MDKLQISEDGRYFVHENGEPFIWLADTAWTVPGRLKWDDVQYYMQTRREHGLPYIRSGTGNLPTN